MEFEFAGNNSVLVTPVVDGVKGTPFSLAYSPAQCISPGSGGGYAGTDGCFCDQWNLRR